MIVKALIELGYGSCKWSVRNEEIYENLNWLDNEVAKPTEEQIQAKLAELQEEYEANQYQRDRQPEYPSIQDQLDMQYWDKVNGTNNWQEAIEAVKTKHPKPE